MQNKKIFYLIDLSKWQTREENAFPEALCVAFVEQCGSPVQDMDAFRANLRKIVLSLHINNDIINMFYGFKKMQKV